jgi:esterase/lipase superfamily enzyme
MHVEYHNWFSSALGHDMSFKVYGHYGQPVLAFPAQEGRYYDFENFGMVEACAGLIDAGRVKIIAVDGIDWQSWTNQGAHPADRARRHEDYDRHIMQEIVPWVQNNTGLKTMWTTGCSMGAFHASNFFFKHPDAFDGVIALSGLYQPHDFVGDAGGESAYFNAPLWYLEHMTDERILNRYRNSRIVFCTGQGAFEEAMIHDTKAMQSLLERKGIPARVEFWGQDVNHDWVWWRKQLPYFLSELLL